MPAPINPSRGDKHHTSKLTTVDAEQIRSLHEWKKREIDRINSIASYQALADKFGVSTACISHVVNYRTW